MKILKIVVRTTKKLKKILVIIINFTHATLQSKRENQMKTD